MKNKVSPVDNWVKCDEEYDNFEKYTARIMAWINLDVHLDLRQVLR